MYRKRTIFCICDKDLFEPEYNIFKIAGSSLGLKHTDEAISESALRRIRTPTHQKMEVLRTSTFERGGKKKCSSVTLGVDTPKGVSTLWVTGYWPNNFRSN
jgi:hypothetical protein